MRHFLFLMSSLCFVLSCSEQQDPQSYLEIDAVIDLSTNLQVSLDAEGIPYIKGYSVSNENFNGYVVGAGWSNTDDKYEVVDNSGIIYLKDLGLWEPGFIFNFYVRSTRQLTEYDGSYRISYGGDTPLLFKNDDYIYSSDGTVRLSDGSFFMRVVYVSADVIQAFKYLYTDQDGKSHYALCTFRKMTQEKLTEFSTTYSTDYYEYTSESSVNP